MKKIFLISFLFLLFFLVAPVQTQAAGLVPCGGYELDADGNFITQPFNDPIPKGWRDIGEGEMAKLEPECQLCHLFVMTDNVLGQMFKWAVPTIAVLMLVIGGALFLFAGAKPNTLTQAKGIITSVVIGLLIIFGAWVIVNTVLEKSGIVDPVKGKNILQWYEISCPTPIGPP